uniref:Factor I / membrane attack complex domain-containing protein n=1 Tax=Knipowitschia caucasica TaxID=637954 RepID=A0AAV2KRT7_KNICA
MWQTLSTSPQESVPMKHSEVYFPLNATVAIPVPDDDFVGPQMCLNQSYTRRSCGLIFCQPWERCVNGECYCKPPYLCPTQNNTAICGLDRPYRSYCHVSNKNE